MKYKVQGPDGKTYTIEGPEGASDEEVIAQAQKLLAPQKPDEFAFDPRRDLTGLERSLAGIGKAGTNLAMGIGQSLGMTDRADVAEMQKRDAPLMNTSEGFWGNAAGNAAALLPTAFIPGANTMAGAATIGGVTGFLAPSSSTSQTLKNMGFGAAAGPAGLALGRLGGALWQGGKALLQPMTQSGQNKIAADLLNASATSPADAIKQMSGATALVPGSQPTVAQVAKDPGLAQLERTLAANPEMAAALQARYAAQRAARGGSLQSLAGTDAYYQGIKEGRKIFGNEDYAKAIAQGVDAKMAQALGPQIENLMARPSIKQAQSVARRLAAEEGIELTEFGSVQGMDWLKKALDNQISKAAQPGSGIGKADLRALMQTKDDLMKTLEQIAPAYKVANDNYAKASKQVAGMDVARSLLDKYTAPSATYGNTAREQGAQFQRALSNATDSVKGVTKIDQPISAVLPTSDIAALEAVARDIARKQFAEEAGRAVGSPTAQNLISQNVLRRTLGPAGLPQSWAESTMLNTLLRPVEFAGKLATPRIQNRLAELLLDPNQAAAVMRMQQSLPITSRLAAESQRYLPGFGSSFAIQGD